MDAQLADRLSSLLLQPQGPFASDDGPEGTYLRTLEVVARLVLENSSLARVRICCTGFNPGEFVCLVDAGSGSEDADPRPRGSQRDLEESGRWMRTLRARKVDLGSTGMPRALFDEDLSNGWMVYWLFSKGEFYGFIEFSGDGAISQRDVSFLHSNIPALAPLLADENFSYRLKFLIEAIPQAQELGQGIDAFIENIAEQTARGFGADAATLRVADEEGVLHLRSRSGAMTAALLEPRQPGDGVSGRVFEQPGRSWAAVHVDTPQFDAGDVELSDGERRKMAGSGIRAALCCKLYSDAAQVDGFGTVTYAFNRPHVFSRRDINLFLAYCARLSDSIQTINALSEAAERASILDVQARRMTYVEIAHLLAHDLWHKSYASLFDAKESLSALQAAIKSDRIRGPEKAIEALRQAATTVVDSAHTLHSTASNLRALANPGAGGESIHRVDRFSVSEVLASIQETLKPALARNKITIVPRGPDTRAIEGPRLIFEQVMFNLFINSIDAARGRAKTRPMRIEVTWHLEGAKLVIRYGDDGPGIDPMVFPNIREVFQIGKTSKTEGTGTGLPIARQLLGTHFGGSIGIETRQPVLFTVDLPLR